MEMYFSSYKSLLLIDLNQRCLDDSQSFDVSIFQHMLLVNVHNDL